MNNPFFIEFSARQDRDAKASINDKWLSYIKGEIA